MKRSSLLLTKFQVSFGMGNLLVLFDKQMDKAGIEDKDVHHISFKPAG
jgi:hypothetical protein